MPGFEEAEGRGGGVPCGRFTLTLVTDRRENPGDVRGGVARTGGTGACDPPTPPPPLLLLLLTAGASVGTGLPNGLGASPAAPLAGEVVAAEAAAVEGDAVEAAEAVLPRARMVPRCAGVVVDDDDDDGAGAAPTTAPSGFLRIVALRFTGVAFCCR